MLIVAGTFEFEAGQREAFLAGRVDAMRQSRSEPGCLEYTFSADPVDPTRVLLFERWESQAALDTHLAGARSAPSSPPPDQPPVAPKAVSIKVYDVTGERPLG